MQEGPSPGKRSLRCLQDARKGILFEDFPPVLQLQLNRFVFDFQQGVHVKVRDTLVVKSGSLQQLNLVFCSLCCHTTLHPCLSRLLTGLLPLLESELGC